jgi:hypothetical protein
VAAGNPFGHYENHPDGVLRRLRLTAGGVLEVEDEAQPDRLRRLCWRFQTYQRNPWTQLAPGCWRLFPPRPPRKPRKQDSYQSVAVL